MIHLGSGGLEVGDQILALLLLLEASEDHLGAGDILLGVLQICEEGVLTPLNTLGDVGLRVGEASGLTSVTAKKTVQVGALLVPSTSLNSVALAALGLKNLGTLSDVSHV